jgi:hypothetical protein
LWTYRKSFASFEVCKFCARAITSANDPLEGAFAGPIAEAGGPVARFGGDWDTRGFTSLGSTAELPTPCCLVPLGAGCLTEASFGTLFALSSRTFFDTSFTNSDGALRLMPFPRAPGVRDRLGSTGFGCVGLAPGVEGRAGGTDFPARILSKNCESELRGVGECRL